MPLDSSFVVTVLRRNSAGIPDSSKISDGDTIYFSGCWVCDWCFPQDGSHPGGSPDTGTTYVREPWCTETKAFCDYYVDPDGGCDIVITAPGGGYSGPDPADLIPPSNPDPGDTDPVGGGSGDDTTPSDSTSTNTDECDSGVPNDENCDGHDDSCNSTQIALAEEHESYGHSLKYPCQKFSKNYAYLIPQTQRDGSPTVGYESEHGGYGLVSGDLLQMYGQAASYLVARGIYESAWRVNSGYRCPNGNSRLSSSGSHPRSRHMCGHAADLGSNTGTPWPNSFAEEMADDMKKLLSTSLSHTKGSYVHIDTDTCPVNTWSF